MIAAELTSMIHDIPLYFISQFLKCGVRDVRRKELEYDLSVSFTDSFPGRDTSQVLNWTSPQGHVASNSSYYSSRIHCV